MLTPKEEFIVNGIYNEWLKKSVDLINDSFGLTFPESTRLKLNFINDKSSSYSVTADYSQSDDADLEINVNMFKWLSIDEKDVNGSGFDNIFAHALTQSVTQANIGNYNHLPSWFVEGAAELIIGGDSRYNEIREILKSGTLNLNSSDYAENCALGYMLLRYYAKETSAHTFETPLEVMKKLMDSLKENNSLIGAINFTSLGTFANVESLIDSFKNLVADANIKTDEDADNFIKNVAGIDYSDYGEVDGGAITGSDAGGTQSKSLKDIIQERPFVENWSYPTENQFTYDGVTIIFPIATDHGDYLINLESDQVTAGRGGSDTIENSGAHASINGGSGNDFIYNRGNGQHSTILGDYGDDYIENFCEYVTIMGGEGEDTILGGESHVTISGDGGDDLIFMPHLEDTVYKFKSGDGNDTINNFNEKNNLHLTGNFETVLSGNDIILEFDKGEIFLQGVADREIILHDNGNYKILTVAVKNSVQPATATNYVYGGGNMNIDNYDANLLVNLDCDFAGIGLDENNFYVNSSSGTLVIKNIRDKVISYGDSSGNLIAYSYMASGGGEIDRQNFPQFEIIIGGNNSSNKIIAGSGGSSMWGGVGGEDTLIGGAGYDEIFFTQGSGCDVIQNAADNDLINLLGVTLENITGVYVDESFVSINLSDSSNLRVEGNSNVGYIVGNSIYRCNQSSGQWTVN